MGQEVPIEQFQRLIFTASNVTSIDHITAETQVERIHHIATSLFAAIAAPQIGEKRLLACDALAALLDCTPDSITPSWLPNAANAACALFDDRSTNVKLASYRTLRAFVTRQVIFVSNNSQLVARICISRYCGTELQRQFALLTWKTLVNGALALSIPSPSSDAIPQITISGSSTESQRNTFATPPTSPRATNSKNNTNNTDDMSTTFFASSPIGIVGKIPGGTLVTHQPIKSSADGGMAPQSGVAFVQRHLPSIVNYYHSLLHESPREEIDVCGYMMLEAAAHGIAELALKLPRDALNERFSAFLVALLHCDAATSEVIRYDTAEIATRVPVSSTSVIHASASSVSDACMCALSRVMTAANDEDIDDELRRVVFHRWINRISHPSVLVRDHAAMALGCYLSKRLSHIRTQQRSPANTTVPSSANIDASISVTDFEELTEVTQFILHSCENFTRKISSEFECNDGEVLTNMITIEGCIYLLRELVLVVPPSATPLRNSFPLVKTAQPQVPAPRNDLPSSTPTISGALVAILDAMTALTEETRMVRNDHSDSSLQLVAQHTIDALCRQLPDICNAIGKQATKRNLDTIIALLLPCVLQCNTFDAQARATAFAATDALSSVAALVGFSIFTGRLSDIQRQQLSVCEIAIALNRKLTIH